MMEEEEEKQTNDTISARLAHQTTEIDTGPNQQTGEVDVTDSKEVKHEVGQEEKYVSGGTVSLDAPSMDAVSMYPTSVEPTSIDSPFINPPSVEPLSEAAGDDVSEAQTNVHMSSSETSENPSSVLTEEQDLANVKIKEEEDEGCYESAMAPTENTAMECTQEDHDKEESSTDNISTNNTTTESIKDSEDSLNCMDINKDDERRQPSNTPSECSETSSEKMRSIRLTKAKDRTAKLLPDEGHIGTRPKIRNIRPGFTFEPGVKLEAMDYLNKWYSAKIVRVDWDAEEVQIHFEGWNARYDEWVDFQSERLRPAPRHSYRRDSGNDGQLRRAGEQVLARWTDCRFYPAEIISANSNGSFQVLFYDGIKKTVQAMNIRDLPPSLQPDKPSKTKEGVYDKDWSRGYGRSKMERSQSLESDSPTAPKRRLSGNNSTPTQAKRVRHESTSPRLKGQVPSPRSHSSSPASSNTSLNSSLGSPITPGLSQFVKKSREPLITDKDVGLTRDPTRKLAPKEMVIDLDHNKYKCDIAGCGKAFRKGSLLDYHKKYYHIGAKPSSWASAASKALSRSRKRLSTPGVVTGAKKSNTPQPAKVQRLRSSAPAALSSRSTKRTGTPTSKSNLSPVSPTSRLKSPLPSKISERLKAQGEKKVKDEGEKREYRPAIRKSLERSSMQEKTDEKGKTVEGTKGKIIEGTKTVEFAKGKTVVVTKGKTVEVTKGKTDEVTKGKTGEITKEKTVDGTSGKIVEGTKGKTVDGTRGKIVEGTKGKTGEGTSGKIVEGTKGKTGEVTKAITVDGSKDISEFGKALTREKPKSLDVSKIRRISVKEDKMNLKLPDKKSSERVEDRKKSTDKVEKDRSKESERSKGEKSKSNDKYRSSSSSDRGRSTDKDRSEHRSSRHHHEKHKKSHKSHRHRDRDSDGSYKYSKKEERHHRKESSSYISQTEEIYVRELTSEQKMEMETSEEGVQTEEVYGDEVVHCVCKMNEEDGFMIQCDSCFCWQHSMCVGLNQISVPKKYICCFCQNPSGERTNAKYQHNQEWFKTGELPQFAFVSDRSHNESPTMMLAAHKLASDIHGVNEMLQGLRQKLKILQSPEESKQELKMWSKGYESKSEQDIVFEHFKLTSTAVEEIDSSVDSSVHEESLHDDVIMEDDLINVDTAKEIPSKTTGNTPPVEPESAASANVSLESSESLVGNDVMKSCDKSERKDEEAPSEITDVSVDQPAISGEKESSEKPQEKIVSKDQPDIVEELVTIASTKNLTEQAEEEDMEVDVVESDDDDEPLSSLKEKWKKSSDEDEVSETIPSKESLADGSKASGKELETKEIIKDVDLHADGSNKETSVTAASNSEEKPDPPEQNSPPVTLPPEPIKDLVKDDATLQDPYIDIMPSTSEKNDMKETFIEVSEKDSGKVSGASKQPDPVPTSMKTPIQSSDIPSTSRNIPDIPIISTPDLSMEGENRSTPDLSMEANKLSTPDVSMAANKLSTPDVNLEADKLNTPDVSLEADKLNTPDLSIEANKLSTPDVSLETDKLSTPDVSMEANKLSTPDVSLEANKLRTPDVSLEADKLNRLDCQLNLLEHVTGVQDDLEERLALIEEQVTALESVQMVPLNKTASKDSFDDMPLAKRRLKMLMADLKKVCEIVTT